MPEFIKKIAPVITLVLLSPIIAELLSGSAPPLIFFNPFQFILRVSLYGSGILIIRELVIKWDKGWGSILILGAAFGVIWEGFAAKAIFKPTWTGLDFIGAYGRWLEVNWVTGTWLVIFHIVYSVSTAILIFNLIFPDQKEKRLVSDKKLVIVFIILFIIVGFFYFLIPVYDSTLQIFCSILRLYSSQFSLDIVITINFFCDLITKPFTPNSIISLITLAVVIFLFITAWKIRKDVLSPRNPEPTIRPKWFALIGATFSIFLLLMNYSSPYLIPLPIVTIILGILMLFLLIIFNFRYLGHEKKEYHLHALISGLLSFYIFLAFIQELKGQFGMSLVGIFFIIFLIYIRKRIEKYQF